MGTTLFPNYSLPWRHRHQKIVPYNHILAHSSQESGTSRSKTTAESRESSFVDRENEKSSGFLKRSVLVSGISLISTSVLGFPGEGFAVVKQGLLAGRIPGLSEPDEQGWFS